MKRLELRRIIKEKTSKESEIKFLQDKINELWEKDKYASGNASDKIRDEIYRLEKKIKQLGGVPYGQKNMKKSELRELIKEEMLKEGFQGEFEENDGLSGFRGNPPITKGLEPKLIFKIYDILSEKYPDVIGLDFTPSSFYFFIHKNI